MTQYTAGGLFRWVANGFQTQEKFWENASEEEHAQWLTDPDCGQTYLICLEEYAKFDADRVEDWRDALDVLLVFAGLFSAVVSTFLTQTSQSLQVDYSQVSAYMMYEMLHLQRAMMDGRPASSVVSSNITPTSPVRPSRTDAWVNVLWYTSLALSLTTALMAVLTKQWIHQYMAVPSGTPVIVVASANFDLSASKNGTYRLSSVCCQSSCMSLSASSFLASFSTSDPSPHPALH
ncbi:hypothetical protein CPB85DRAFT_1435178 [Mucidula mucida]|nr:hypothetical protein CPB85DRAFT_1435178 [Mucidula mucida]